MKSKIDTLHKRISVDDKNLCLLYGDCLDGKEIKTMTEIYISNIRLSKIMLPDCELVLDRSDSFLMIQEKIQGQTAKQYITQSGCYEGILKVYQTILFDVLKLYINNSFIAVDLNLENFIIADNEIYLVDFAPPLLLQYTKRSNSLLNRLFCDRIYQLYAMNYYFCKGVILNDCINDEERIALVKYFFQMSSFAINLSRMIFALFHHL